MRKSIIQLFGGNLFSKVLGFAREVVVAALFGTGPVMGAYRVAQTGTLSPVNFFTSDALNSAFVPQFKLFHSQSADKAQTFFWGLFGFFCLLALVIGLCLWFAAAPWVDVLAPGLNAYTADLSTKMLQIMGLGVPFYLLSAILIFLGMANEDFTPMAIRAVIQNFGLLVGAALAYLLKDVLFLAWGFTASYMAFGFWVFFRMLFAGFLAFPKRWNSTFVKAVMFSFLRTLRPLLLLPVLLQGNIVIERMVASLIGLVAVSALDYARFVTETLLMLLAIPVAFAGLTHWCNLSTEAMQERLQKVLLLLLLISVPISIFLAVHAYEIVSAIYQRGAFDQKSVQVTADILFGVALGLWAQVIGYVLIKALNAQMRNFAAFMLMAVALVANAVFNLTMHPLLGGMTLGLGNSIYGLILLMGTLFSFKLWHCFFAGTWLIALGGIIYLGIDQFALQGFSYLGIDNFSVNELGLLGFNQHLTLFNSVWVRLFGDIVFALVFWGLWIALIPSLRNLFVDLVAPQRRKIV